MAVIWNKYAGSTHGWPAQFVSVPNNSKVYFVGWDRFPPTLKAEIDDHLGSLSSPDLFDSRSGRQLKPGSIKARRHNHSQMPFAVQLVQEVVSARRNHVASRSTVCAIGSDSVDDRMRGANEQHRLRGRPVSNL